VLKRSLQYYYLTFNFKLFFKGTNYLQAFLSVNVSMPQVPIMNFREALKFNPNSTVSAQLDVIDGANNQAKAVLKVSPFHSHFQFYSCPSAIDLTASCRTFIAKVWVWSQGGLGGICGEQSRKKTGTYVLPVNYHSKNASCLFIYQQLIDGQLAQYRL